MTISPTNSALACILIAAVSVVVAYELHNNYGYLFTSSPKAVETTSEARF